jgi:hypothetical protein
MRPFKLFLIVLPALLLIGLSLVAAAYLGQGAERLDLRLGAADSAPLEAFQDGYRLERAGDLDEALAKYRIAFKSPLPDVHEAARRAIDRVTGKLHAWGTVHRDLRTLAEWSLRIGLAWLAVLLVIGVFSLLSRLRRPRGTEIRRFSVIPEYEPNFSIQFDRILLQEIARIAHAYQSVQLRRIGAAMTSPDANADSELQGLETRAVAALRQGDTKSIIGFGLAELFLWWQNINFRPEQVLSGTVILRPGEATAHAQLAGLGRDRTLAVLDASSLEIASAAGSPSPAAAAASTAAAASVLATVDRREDAQYLADLATVLACKFSVRWMEKMSPDRRPSSWQTVYNMSRGLSALEAAT